jgi:hypothetical protein
MCDYDLRRMLLDLACEAIFPGYHSKGDNTTKGYTNFDLVFLKILTSIIIDSHSIDCSLVVTRSKVKAIT